MDASHNPDKIRVLYVDDEPILLDLCKMFLERSGDFTVTIVSGAPEAIRLLEKERFDAIVSDYQMPVMDGIEFLKYIRARGDRTPLIIFTGKGREEIVIQALNSGADFYLQKGGEAKSQFAELAHKIRLAVQQRQAEVAIRDHERREGDIINFLPDATFAIDTNGIVIAWNRAIEEMTGVMAEEMIGKGDYEYSVPVYHERRPVLIDLILHDDPSIAAKYPSMKREGRTLVAETTSPYLYNGRGATIWFTAAPLYNNQGIIVGAIESIRDITDLKRTEKALAESEARFRALVENASDVIRILDREGRIVFDTTTSGRDLGYPPGYTIGRYPFEFIHPDDLAMVKQRLSGVYTKTSTDVPAEFRIRKADGSYIWVDSVGRNLIGVPGVDGVVITTRFIDERKRAEVALKESEQFTREIIQNAKEGIIVYDRNFNYVVWNPFMESLTGISASEALGKNAIDLFPHLKEQKLNILLQQALSGETVQSPDTPFHIPQTKKSGWVSSIYSPHFNAQGEIVGVIGIIRDITKRKKAEDELRESEEKYRLIADNTTDNIWIFDMDLNLKYMSPSVKKIRGFTVEEAMHQSLEQMMTHESCESVMQRFQEEMVLDATGTADPGRVVSFESEEYCKDGSTIWMENSAVLLRDGNGRPTGILGISRDITERKRAEEALRESENKYRSIVEQSLMGIGVSKGNQVIFANKALLRIFNYDTLEEFKQIPLLDHVAPSSKKIITDGYKMFAEGKHPSSEFEFEYDILCKGGLTKTLHAISTQMSMGGEVYNQTIFQDITGRKKTELELKSALDNLKEAHQLAHIGTWDWVKENDIVIWSEELYNIAGRDPSLPAPTYAEHPNVYSPASWDRLSSAVTRALTTGEPYELELELVRPDGSIRWVNAFGAVKRDGKDTINGLHGTVQDITDRKVIQDALQASENRYRRLFETAQDGILILDGDTGKIIDANTFILDMLGYPISYFVGKHLWELGFIRDKSIAEHAFKELKTNGYIRYEDLPLETKDGRSIDVEFISNLYTVNHHKIIQCNIRDITARKRAEEALRQTNKQLNLLSSITRHDIQNQLLTLRANIELSREFLDDRKTLLEFMEKEAKAAETIEHQIRFTKDYQDLGAAAPAWQNVNECIRNAIAALPMGAVQVWPDPANPEVYADILFDKVFYNLVDNALRYGGAEMKTIRVSSQESETGLTIICEDDGVGISAEDKKLLFTRGFGKNTGLGLFLSREILAITGITITENGTPGKGARFEIMVPTCAYRFTGTGNE